jgi:WD40 repeat protein
VAFSPDGQRLASGGGARFGKIGEVKVWDAQTGQELHTLKGHTGPVTSLAFSPDGEKLLSRGPEIFAWNVKTGKALGTPRGPVHFASRMAARHPS